MIKLSILRDPVVVDLSDIAPGFGLTIKRLTSMELAEAREAAAQVIRDLEKGLAALAPYGLDSADVLGMRVNLKDPVQMLRIGYLIGAVEVAIRGVIEWRGIVEGDENATAPISRDRLAIVLMDDGICQRVLGEINKAAHILAVEGKGLGVSLSGSLEPGATA